MLNIHNLTVSFQGDDLFSGITFQLRSGDRVGLVGKNGAGKSTLLKILSGEQEYDTGQIASDKQISIGFLKQDIDFVKGRTVLEEAYEAFKLIKQLENQLENINNQLAERTDYESESYHQLMVDLNDVQHQYEIHGGYNYQGDTERVLQGLGFQREDFNMATDTFSGGWRMRIELAKLLLQNNDILLLDEPTNHLDAESVHWLEHHLAQYKGTVIAVTHDRYFLDNVAGWILELDRGEGIPWKGNYSSWLDQKSQRMAKESKTASKRQKTLERELEWVRQGAKGRQTKQKARLKNYDKLMSQDQKQVDAKLEIYIPNGPRLGTNVIEATGVSKAFDDKLLYEDLAFNLPQAGIVGIIGPNGAGKTTIFKMIMGEETPDKGNFNVGETAKIAYVDQAHSNIDPNKTIWENFSEGQDLVMMGGKQVNSRAYLSRFNFSGSEQNKKVSTLSGGERNRLHLAMTLKEEGNVLLLDEPTNDLDVNTLRALEEGLENFAGCAVVISHDRWFLDRVCTHILAFEGDSQVYFFEGSFSDYEENKKKRLGGDLMPKRIKYKKLIR